MKQILVALLLAGAAAQITWSQTTRQAAPAQAAVNPQSAIAEATVQLSLLDKSHAQLMDGAEKMASSSSSLYTKAYALCGVREKVTPPDAAKAVAELCAVMPQWSQQAATFRTQMENENRQFTSISNVLKTKHDTVKNSISNVR